MPESGNTGLVVFGLYLLTVIGIGIWSSRYQRTTEDFWVAGRRFGLGVMIIANMAAIMHGGSILSGIAFSGQFGGVSALPFAAFAGGFAVIFFFFAKKLRQSGGFTIPDYMGDRFDSNWLRGWSAIVVALSSTIYLVAQIRGMAFILETLLDVPFFSGLVIGTLIFVAYVALGGLLAVVWTNIAQFAFMWLGLLILAPFVYREVGGWFSVIEQVEALAPGWTSVRGVQWTGWYMMSWYMIWFVAYCTRLELLTKMFAARDDQIARYSLPWSILLVMIFLLYGTLYLGGAARILVWDQLVSADQAFPVLVATVLTPTLAAIALTGIASAAMSTSDSLLLLSGSAIAHDLLRKCIHEPKNIVKDEHYYVRVSRLAIIGIGIVAFLCAIPDFALILRIVSFAIAIVGSAFFFPLLVGLTSQRVSTLAALSSSVGGVVVTVIWIIATLGGVGWAQALHPGIPGLITAGLTMAIVARFSSGTSKYALRKYFPEAR